MPTRPELLAEAKSRGLKGYSTLKKADLQKLLDTPPPKPPRGVPRGTKAKAGGGAKPAPRKVVKGFGIKKTIEKAQKKEQKKMEKNKLVEKIEQGEFFTDIYMDVVEDFLDGRGSEEKQLDRASVKAGSFIRKQIKKAIKKDKIKTVEEFNSKYNTISKIRDVLDM